MATTAAYGVNFVNKDEARGILARLFKHVANTTCPHAYEHLHEIRTAYAKEGRIGFSGNGFSQESLARSWRADHEDTFRNTSAEPLKLFRILKKFNQLRHFFDSFVDSRNVLEGSFVAFLGE